MLPRLLIFISYVFFCLAALNTLIPFIVDANLTAENYIVKEETYQNVDLYQDVPRIPENIKAVEEPILNTNNSYRCSGPKKPPFTYTELIEHALNEKGELTVSGIYRWIS